LATFGIGLLHSTTMAATALTITYGLRSVKQLRILDFGLRIGVQPAIRNPQSAIQNPKSKIQNPKSKIQNQLGSEQLLRLNDRLRNILHLCPLITGALT